MANRYLNQFQLTYEKDSVTIYGSITMGSSGAVASFAGGGIANVTKTGTGEYTVTLTNSFKRFLGLNTQMIASTASTTAKVQLKMNPSTLQDQICNQKLMVLQAIDYAGAALNPTSGEVIELQIILRNSSIGPFDQ